MGESARPGGFVVRDARLDDVGRIFGICSHALGALDATDCEWLRALVGARSRRKRVVVVESGGFIVGFAIVYKRGRAAFLDSIAVDEGMRGCGVGGFLLGVLEERLASEGVEFITLSVKNWNMRALDFYLRRGYVVRGIVMLFSADPREIGVPHSGNHYTVEEMPAEELKYLRLRPTTWWSNLIEEVHRIIYKRYLRGERAVVVKSGRRIRGVAEFTCNNGLFVNYVALSSYNATKVLENIVRKLRAKAINEGRKEIVIPVDASKGLLVSELVSMNFHTQETEYLLSKDLSGSGAKSLSKCVSR